MDNMKILLMYAGVYHIDAKDGQPANDGCSVEYYFFGDKGEALQPAPPKDSVGGIRRSKGNIDIFLFDSKVKEVPGVYDASFGMKVGADGKPVLQLKNLDYIGKPVFDIENIDSKKG